MDSSFKAFFMHSRGKNKNLIQYFAFFSSTLFILFYGCSDWLLNQNPSKENVTVQAYPEIWEKINLPANVSALLPYSYTANIACSPDGKVYRSVDNCFTWRNLNVGNIKGTVNNLVYIQVTSVPLFFL